MLNMGGTHNDYCFVKKISNMGQVGHNESDDIIFPGEKAKELW